MREAGWGPPALPTHPASRIPHPGLSLFSRRSAVSRRNRRTGGEGGAIDRSPQTYSQPAIADASMPPSRPGDTAKDLLKALAELRDAATQLPASTRALEDRARRLVQSVRRATDHRAEFAPVRAADFPALDLAYYARTERELAATGVRLLGDYEDAAFNRRSPDKRSFYRLALSDDGTVAASCFVFPAGSAAQPAREPTRCLVLHSWAEDGREFMTMRGGSESNIPAPPWLDRQQLGAETATAGAVRAHRERVAAAAGALRSLTSVDQLLAALQAEEAMIAEFRSA